MKRRHKIGLLAAGVILVILIGVAVGLHFHLKHKVAAFRAELRQQGEELNFEKLLRPPPADLANGGPQIAMAGGMLPKDFLIDDKFREVPLIDAGKAHVMWRNPTVPAYVQYQGYSTNAWPAVVQALRDNAGNLAEAQTAAARAVIYFPLDYRQGIFLNLSHPWNLHRVAQWLAAATLDDLNQGRQGNAWSNLHALTCIAVRWGNEPVPISQLFRRGCQSTAAATTWQWLQQPGFTEAQLAELQELWLEGELFPNAERTVAMELALVEVNFRKFRQQPTILNDGNPIGSKLWTDPGRAFGNLYYNTIWLHYVSYRDELVLLQGFQAQLQGLRKAFKSSAPNEAVAFIERRQRELCIGTGPDGECNHDLVSILMTVADDYPMRMAVSETRRRLLVAVLALERFRLAKGRYPTVLVDLTPGWLKAVPLDPMDGKPLRYRLKPDGAFLLYSVGRDGKDDGGDPASPGKSDKPSWLRAKDIVWPQPASDEEAKAFYEQKMNPQK